MKYRKKPTEVEAMQLTENNHLQLSDFVTERKTHRISFVYDYAILQDLQNTINTVKIGLGDYIVKYDDLLSSCDKDIFESTYSLVEETKEKTLTVNEIKKKLLELNPQIKSDKYTNPFIYRDVTRWYNELCELINE